MQSESKIRHRLKLLRFRYMEKEMRKAESRKPCNCRFNSSTRIPGSKDTVLRVCAFTEDDKLRGMACDERYSGDQVVAKCPYFEPIRSAESARDEFNEFWDNAPASEFASKYPDAMALLWTLEEQDFRNEVDMPTEEELRNVFGSSVPSPESFPISMIIVEIPTGDSTVMWTPFKEFPPEPKMEFLHA